MTEWLVESTHINANTGFVHVVPANEASNHELGPSGTCWCGPTIYVRPDGVRVVSHNQAS